MADPSTFLGSLTSVSVYKPAQAKAVRWTSLAVLLALSLFGCYELYHVLSRVTKTVWRCDEHPSVSSALSGACPQGDHPLKAFERPSWFSMELYRGRFLGVEIFLVNAFWVALAVWLATGWILFRFLQWSRAAEFLIDTEGELRRVSWPAQKEFINASLVVLILSACISAFLYGVDHVLSAVLQKFHIGI